MTHMHDELIIKIMVQLMQYKTKVTT